MSRLPRRIAVTLLVVVMLGTVAATARITAWPILRDYLAMKAALEPLRSPDISRRSAARRALVKGGTQSIPIFIMATSDRIPNVRVAGVESLGEIGFGSVPAVRAIGSALHDRDEDVRLGAAEALLMLGRGGKAAVPDLIGALEDEWPRIRRAAAEALGRMGPDARSAIAPLQLHLNDSEAVVRVAAAEALWKVGGDIAEALPVLVDAMQLDGDARFEAINTIAIIGPPAAPAIPALIQQLKDDDSFAERHGYLAYDEHAALARIGAPALPELIAALASDDVRLRVKAALILAEFEPELAAPAVPRLLSLIEDDSKPNSGVEYEVGEAAAMALKKIGPLAAPFALGLYEVLENPSIPARVRAVTTIWNIYGDSNAVVPVLIEALKDESIEIRRLGASAVAEIGPAASEVIPYLFDAVRQLSSVRPYELDDMDFSAAIYLAAEPRVLAELVEALHDDHSRVREDAVAAIGKLGSDAAAAVPDLLDVARSDHSLRSKVVEALGRIGPRASAAVPELCDLLNDGDTLTTSLAIQALESMGSDALEAVPRLVARLGTGNYYHSASAAKALGIIGLGASQATPQLSIAARHGNIVCRIAAAESLWRISQDSDAIPLLISTLGNDESLLASNNSPTVSELAAEALGRIGSPSVPALMDVLSRPDRYARVGAAKALGLIGPDAKAATPLLIRMLEKESDPERTAAAESLGKLGSAAASALPALDDARMSGADEVRAAAIAAVKNIWR